MSSPDDRFTQWDPDDLRRPAMDRSGNVHGEAIAMTAVSELRWWGRLWLPILFWATRRFPALTRTLHGLQFIHFAHWSIVGDKLLFISNFNGGWEEYIRAFSKRLTRGMRLFWGSSKGFPGPVPVEPFLAYIAEHERVASMYWSAYPDADTARVERALAGHKPTSQVSVFTTLLSNRLEVFDRSIFRDTGAHFARLVDTDLGQVFSAVHDGTKAQFLDRLVKAGILFDKPGWLRNEIKPGLFYAAYHATVDEVRDALARQPEGVENWEPEGIRDRPAIARLLGFLTAKQSEERCQHADLVGVVDATLVPRPDRPDWCKHGILERHAEYPCKVRFSTEGRALGIGIVANYTDGEAVLSSDFALATGWAFFAKDAEEVAEFQERRAEGQTLRFFFPGLTGWRLRGLHNLLVAGRMYPWMRRWRNPLAAKYCSLTAFQHGPQVVRWLVRPSGELEYIPGGMRLREALAYQLRLVADVRFEGTLDLCAQAQSDPVRQDPEDARLRWDEMRSPWVPVAWLRIPPQELQEDCPPVRLKGGLGSVNRARAEVYPALQELRE